MGAHCLASVFQEQNQNAKNLSLDAGVWVPLSKLRGPVSAGAGAASPKNPHSANMCRTSDGRKQETKEQTAEPRTLKGGGHTKSPHPSRIGKPQESRDGRS